MASYGDVLAVLKEFRNDLERKVHHDINERASPGLQAFASRARGGLSAFSTASTNVHASGAGIRVRNGFPVPNEFVIKVYVFDKFPEQRGDALVTTFDGIDVDVEQLPVQLALHAAPAAKVPSNRKRHRPIPAGVSIAPINESYVGTLGIFLSRRGPGAEQIYILSNNHVLADTNRLPIGTPIGQPGPEKSPINPEDVFASLSSFVPLLFPTHPSSTPTNRFDAAIAIVSDPSLIITGKILDINKYVPTIGTAVPGMRVIKSGRTTGVTHGIVTATRVNGVQVNYGTQASPFIATFNDTIEVIGLDDQTFSKPGDSGAIILEESTGHPVALLFAGDGHTTTACDIGGVCQQFSAQPV